MPIIRWRPFGSLGTAYQRDPFQELESMRTEMNRLFERWNGSADGEENAGDRLAFMPSAEMEDKDDSILLKLEVPGMSAEELDIEIHDNVATIRGERKSESETEANGVKRSEFTYGKFERSVRLPAKVNSEAAEANYENGILMLTMPKLEDEKPKAVKVSVK